MSAENVERLKKRIALLEHRIEVFEERVERARFLTEMLIRSKASDPGYPFWEWEHRQFFSHEVRINVRRVVSTLSFRLEGTWEFDESCKDVPGIPSDQLYQSRPPTIDEVYTFVKIAAGFASNEKVTEMFMAQRLNEFPNTLIDFVLAGK